MFLVNRVRATQCRWKIVFVSFHINRCYTSLDHRIVHLIAFHLFFFNRSLGVHKRGASQKNRMLPLSQHASSGKPFGPLDCKLGRENVAFNVCGCGRAAETGSLAQRATTIATVLKQQRLALYLLHVCDRNAVLVRWQS